MLLSVCGIAKAFGEKQILRDIHFNIEAKEKVALVGANGAGKTTLFRLISGQTEPDDGEIIRPAGMRYGYLEQMLGMTQGRSIRGELMSVFAPLIAKEKALRELERQMADLEGDALQKTVQRYGKLGLEFETQSGYEYETLVNSMLQNLGFGREAADQPVETLSGGEKERLAFGKLLFSHPDLLLLDEPTNHLDLPSVAWLENYIKNYDGAVLAISHDRYFLNQFAQKTIEIVNGQSHVFLGDYDAYTQKKRARREEAYTAYLLQQKEIKRQQEVIRTLRSYNREKSIARAESRQKLLDKTEKLGRPEDLPSTMRLHIEPRRQSGQEVLRLSGLTKSFGPQPLFGQIDLELCRGEKLALIGPNGCGKTTLLKILLGEEEADCGAIKLGAGVQIGYYDQEHRSIDPKKSLFDEIYDANPNLSVQQIYATLAAFVFTGDKVWQKTASLSAGERGRLLLAKIMLSAANFLLLDEPTNHLDIDSKEILEEALQNYTGTLLFVSHDRYFINRVATRVAVLSRAGLAFYEGNYDDYLRQKASLNGQPLTEAALAAEQSATEPPSDYQLQKQRQSAARKLKNQYGRTKTEIAALEQKISDLEKELAKEEVSCDPQRAAAAYTEQCALEDKLLAQYALAEDLLSQME